MHQKNKQENQKFNSDLQVLKENLENNEKKIKRKFRRNEK